MKRMRRWILGAVIVLSIALGTMAAAYVALGHFYGATQREVYMQVENNVASITSVSWEEAEASNAPILIYEENTDTDAPAAPIIVSWDQTNFLGKVWVQNFDNAVLENSLVLSPTNDANPFSQGQVWRAQTAASNGLTLYRWTGQTKSVEPAATSYDAENAYTSGGDDETYSPAPSLSSDTEAPEAPTITSWSPNVENGVSGTFIVSATTPPDPMPLAASLGIAAGVIVFAAWIGYRRAWGDATSTLLDHGLRDMTVRDVEIVGYIMERGKFTIPELMKQTKASKITVWRTVQKLVEQGLVRPTEQTKLAANGIGGRGKPSHIYEYVGEKGAKSGT